MMKKIIVSVLSALCIGSFAVCLTGCGGPKDVAPAEIKYEYVYSSQFEGANDPDILIDGKLDETVWQNKKWYTSKFYTDINDVMPKLTVTAFNTVYGAYVGVKIRDDNILYNGMLNPSKNSTLEFYFYADKTDTVVEDLDRSLRRAFMMDYNGELYSTGERMKRAFSVDGEINSGNTTGATVEIFIPWSEMGIDVSDGIYPQKFYLLPTYRPILKGNTGHTPLFNKPFNPMHHINDYYIFDEDGYTDADAENAVVGDAYNGTAKSASWDLEDLDQGVVSVTDAGEFNYIYFRDAFHETFQAETTIYPMGGCEKRAGWFGGFFILATNGNYYTMTLDLRAERWVTAQDGGNALNKFSLTTLTEAHGGAWEQVNKANKSNPAAKGIPEKSGVKFKIIMNKNTVYYFADDYYLYSETLDFINGKVYVGLYNQNVYAQYKDYSFKGLTEEEAAEEVEELTKIESIAINNVTDWNNISNNLDGYYVLNSDIDFDGDVIARIDDDFSGVIDGQGHKVSNFIIDRTNSSLFGTVGAGAIIKNIAFTNVTVVGGVGGTNANTALISTFEFRGTLQDIYVQYDSITGLDTSGNNYIGLVFGRIGAPYDGYVVPKNVIIDVTACATDLQDNINDLNFTNANAWKVLSGFGRWEETQIDLDSCFLVGADYITICAKDYGLYTNSYADYDALMSAGKTYTGWNMTSMWTIVDGVPKPTCLGDTNNENRRILIKSKENWSLLNDNKDGSFVLTSDIDFDGDVITRVDDGFNGVIDGKGHKVSNFTINSTNQSLFGTVGANAVIKNIVFTNVNIVGGVGGSNANTALISTFEFSGTLQDIYVQYDSITGLDTSGNNCIGLVLGRTGAPENFVAPAHVIIDVTACASALEANINDLNSTNGNAWEVLSGFGRWEGTQIDLDSCFLIGADYITICAGSVYTNSYTDYEALKNANKTYTDWNTTSMWTIVDGVPKATCIVKAEIENRKILISSKEDWSLLNDNKNGKFLLENDIDFGGEAITRIGDGFYGTIDGQGHKISNFTINSTNQSLFGTVGSAAVIKNIAFTNVTMVGGADTALISTYDFKGTLQDIYVQYDSITGLDTSGSKRMGLVFGRLGAPYDGYVVPKNVIIDVTACASTLEANINDLNSTNGNAWKILSGFGRWEETQIDLDSCFLIGADYITICAKDYGRYTNSYTDYEALKNANKTYTGWNTTSMWTIIDGVPKATATID